MIAESWLAERIPHWLQLAQRGAKEANTEDKIVSPLLLRLGWNPEDSSAVEAQYDVGGEELDFVLLGHRGEPVIAIEVKRAGLDLGSSISSGTLDLTKYLAQAKRIRARMLLLTTGIEYRFYTPIDVGRTSAWRECIGARIELTSDSTGLARIASVLANLERARVLDPDSSLTSFADIASSEHAGETVREALNSASPALIRTLAGLTRLPPDRIKRALQTLSGPVRQDWQPEAHASTEVSEAVRALRRKMTDTTDGARKWRSKVRKYLPIWERLAAREWVNRGEVLDEVARVVRSQKGRAVFFGAYVGVRAKTRLIDERTDSTGDTQLQIRAELRESLQRMITLMRTDSARR